MLAPYLLPFHRELAVWAPRRESEPVVLPHSPCPPSHTPLGRGLRRVGNTHVSFFNNQKWRGPDRMLSALSQPGNS